jgi:Zn-dependent peptidase ImmA (M78 family)
MGEIRRGTMVVFAEPIQRVKLRALALKIREMSGYNDELYFPIVQFVEHKMPLFFPDFHLEVMPKSYFPPKVHGETAIREKVIRIREDVYNGAINEVGRDRMTMAHEAGHYILLIAKGLKLYRSFEGAEIKAFRDPEWQAKAFAGELLCPFHLIKGMAASQIMLACGVSDQAAQYHFDLRNPSTRRFKY